MVAETTATPPPAVSALTTPDKPSGPALVVQERSGGIPPAQNPFTLWRILEGVTAITALTFLVMWLLRRRTGVALPLSGSSPIPIRCPERRLSRPFCLMKIRPFIDSFHRLRFYPELIVCWPGIFLDGGPS